eukprot:scaffold12691_cov108-Isochrysis_galbana.AAC.2
MSHLSPAYEIVARTTQHELLLKIGDFVVVLVAIRVRVSLMPDAELRVAVGRGPHAFRLFVVFCEPLTQRRSLSHLPAAGPASSASTHWPTGHNGAGVRTVWGRGGTC